MIDAGVWVRCLDVKGGKVIVRQMEPPADVADISPDAPLAEETRQRPRLRLPQRQSDPTTSTTSTSAWIGSSPFVESETTTL